MRNLNISILIPIGLTRLTKTSYFELSLLDITKEDWALIWYKNIEEGKLLTYVICKLPYLSITSFFKPLNKTANADASCPWEFRKKLKN
jgi:hypothetical protein